MHSSMSDKELKEFCISYFFVFQQTTNCFSISFCFFRSLVHPSVALYQDGEVCKEIIGQFPTPGMLIHSNRVKIWTLFLFKYSPDNNFNYHGLAQRLKCLPTMRETQVQSLGWVDLLEKEMATHSSILAWRIPWTEEPFGLQSTGCQRVGHD